jgi:site-specific DNA-cytosine methylase
MKIRTQLSLCDGISGGQMAGDRIGLHADTYIASEIDKYAISITQKNYPNTIQVGDMTEWRSWDIDWSQVDLVTAGFPCQAWSVAGQQQGDRDPRGQLFWVVLDIMQHVLEHNPNAKYIMENVRMSNAFEEYITYHTEQALPNVNKYLINSALVSAQNRKRFYWTNIEGIQQPEDKGIVLKDILEDGLTDRTKSHCLDANYFKGGNLKSYFEKHRRQLVFSDDQM